MLLMDREVALIKKTTFCLSLFNPIRCFCVPFISFLFTALVKSSFLEGLVAFLQITSDSLLTYVGLISTPAPAESFSISPPLCNGFCLLFFG